MSSSFNIVDLAKAQQPNLEIGQGVTVEVSSGRFAGKKVIVVRPPIEGQTEDMKRDLHTTYQTIFELYANRSGDHETLLVPCFSTGQGGVTPEVSASIAFQEANEFIRKDPRAHIQFVCYTDKGGQRNLKVYQQALKKWQKEHRDQAEQIEVISGDVSTLPGQFRVMPVREGYDMGKSGPIALNILKSFQQPAPQVRAPSPVPRSQSTSLADDPRYLGDDDL